VKEVEYEITNILQGNIMNGSRHFKYRMKRKKPIFTFSFDGRIKNHKPVFVMVIVELSAVK